MSVDFSGFYVLYQLGNESKCNQKADKNNLYLRSQNPHLF